jgi:hypothetical protein
MAGSDRSCNFQSMHDLEWATLMRSVKVRECSVDRISLWLLWHALPMGLGAEQEV